MERDYFVFNTQVSFSIVSDDIEIDPVSITDDLQINPSRVHKKGTQFRAKHSGTLCTKSRTVWAIDSEWTLLPKETISHHIEYFKEIFLPKAAILKKYKDDDRVELTFRIDVKTDDAGFSLDLDEKEISFLNNFSNRLSISLITDSTLENMEATA